MGDYNDLPIYLIPTGSSRATKSGLYVFTGSSACTITMASVTPTMRRPPDSRLMCFKNRGSALMTIQTGSGNIFDLVSVASIVLSPGEGALLIPDNGFYSVVARDGLPKLATASRPAWSSAYVGVSYFDTTLSKIVVGGAAAWEVVTSV